MESSGSEARTRKSHLHLGLKKGDCDKMASVFLVLRRGTADIKQSKGTKPSIVEYVGRSRAA